MNNAMKIRPLLHRSLFCSFLLISSCGSDSSSTRNDNKAETKAEIKEETETNKYQGFWSHNDSSSYLKIDNKGAVTVYTCAFTEGYKTDGTVAGNVSGDTLTPTDNSIDPIIFKLSNDSFEFSFTDSEVTTSYNKANQLPQVCTGDGIEITSINPKVATEGQLTTFTISFTYQVESTSAAVIKPGFTFENGDNILLADEEFNVGKKGLSSASMVVTETPVIFDSKKPFKLHLEMFKSEDLKMSTFRSIASHETTITVIPAL